jgi:hypothetical protein
MESFSSAPSLISKSSMRFTPVEATERILPLTPKEHNVNPFTRSSTNYSLGSLKKSSSFGKRAVKSFPKIASRASAISMFSSKSVDSKPPAPIMIMKANSTMVETTRLILEFSPILLAKQLLLIEYEIARDCKPMEIMQNIERYDTSKSILFDEEGWIHNRTCVTVWRQWTREIGLSGLERGGKEPVNKKLPLPPIITSFERVFIYCLIIVDI